MALYPTIDIDANATANLTTAYIPLKIDKVDLYRAILTWGVDYAGDMIVTITRPDLTTFSKTSTNAVDSPIKILNTEPAYVKLLMLDTDLTIPGIYKAVFKFKQDDGWIVAPSVTFTVLP